MIEQMKIFVSGGSGHIGSSLVERLVRYGHEVTNFDIEYPKYRELIQGKELLFRADIRDYNAVKSAMPDHEVVFHLAAMPYIPDGYLQPRDMVETDMIGTLNMLLAAKEVGVKHFIHFSSSETYGSAKYVPMDEKHPTEPISTYAVAKLGADRLAHTFGHEQKLPFTILRQFNVIGERDTHHRIAPYIVSELVEGRTNIKLGHSGSSRDFTYVEDVADACVKCINNKKALGETINIGTGKTYKGYEIAYLVAQKLNIPRITFELDKLQVRPLDVDVLCAANYKAERLLGWRPKVGLSEALNKLIEWRKRNRWTWEGYYLNYKYRA